MKITSRKTHSFIELQVDETETTLFKSHPEVEGMIYNLLEIANDLASYTDKSLKDYLTFFQNENIYTEVQVLEIIKMSRQTKEVEGIKFPIPKYTEQEIIDTIKN